MILDQQIEIHFGEEYDATLASVLKYTKTILNSPPLMAQKYRIFNCEGGGANLSRLALSFIIEKGDVNNGLRAFSSYLNNEYSSSNNRAKTHHTKWSFLADYDDPPQQEGSNAKVEEVTEPFRVPVTPSGDLQSLRPHVGQSLHLILQDDEERDLYNTLSSLNYVVGNRKVGRQRSYGKLKEAFELIGLSDADGMRIYWRIKRRLERLEPAR